MELEQYWRLLDRLCARAFLAGTGVLPWVEEQLVAGDRDLLEAIATRAALLAPSDRERVDGLMKETGAFSGLDEQRRTAVLIVTIELEDSVVAKGLARQCEAYSPSQPLFRELPQLLKIARKRELIPISALGTVRPDGIVGVSRRFARLGPFVPVAAIAYLRESYPAVPLFVRLDPYFVAHEEPPVSLLEDIRIPPNPNWWRTLGIRIGAREGGVYELRDTHTAADDRAKFWDYHVRGVRRTETSAIRRDADHLAMMVEELQVDGSHRLLGRCIHLDTRCVDGYTPGTSPLAHLDLAINIYEQADGKARMQGYLRAGKVQDASRRTHLLRTEGVLLQEVIPICEQFFESICLTREMIEAEFV